MSSSTKDGVADPWVSTIERTDSLVEAADVVSAYFGQRERNPVVTRALISSLAELRACCQRARAASRARDADRLLDAREQLATSVQRLGSKAGMDLLPEAEQPPQVPQKVW